MNANNIPKDFNPGRRLALQTAAAVAAATAAAPAASAEVIVATTTTLAAAPAEVITAAPAVAPVAAATATDLSKLMPLINRLITHHVDITEAAQYTGKPFRYAASLINTYHDTRISSDHSKPHAALDEVESLSGISSYIAKRLNPTYTLANYFGEDIRDLSFGDIAIDSPFLGHIKTELGKKLTEKMWGDAFGELRQSMEKSGHTHMTVGEYLDELSGRFGAEVKKLSRTAVKKLHARNMKHLIEDEGYTPEDARQKIWEWWSVGGESGELSSLQELQVHCHESFLEKFKPADFQEVYERKQSEYWGRWNSTWTPSQRNEPTPQQKLPPKPTYKDIALEYAKNIYGVTLWKTAQTEPFAVMIGVMGVEKPVLPALRIALQGMIIPSINLQCTRVDDEVLVRAEPPEAFIALRSALKSKPAVNEP